MSPQAKSRYVICGECPRAYAASSIDVFLGDENKGTLERLESRSPAQNEDGPASGKLIRKFLGLKTTPEPAGRTLDLTRLQRYTFKCPQGHAVDGNRGVQFPLAILGASGASKSHFLPAIVRELDDLRTLSDVGVTLGTSLYANSKITDDASEIYRQNRVLDATPMDDGVLGPYGYKLKVGNGPKDATPKEMSLLLFDVAGESLADVMRLAEAARFVLMSEAILVLIDPEKFLPSSFDDGATPSGRRVNAAVDVRKGIRVILESLSEAWSTQSSALNVPICFVVGKADAVEWPADFNWEDLSKDTLAEIQAGADITTSLQAASDAVRKALIDLGGETVVDEVESELDTKWVRFAAASATCAMPKSFESMPGSSTAASASMSGLIVPRSAETTGWMSEPEPLGVGLALLQAFDMAGILPDTLTAAQPDVVTADAEE